ncbi:unnamed protein product [Nezara viridula]|uniref:Uncharacterized protein n=1 Tax=Nezara viridula TaxID=85310 RepID=A0A9P0MWM3_NEZVI|nr:unnamed protein product [Nezara viridula]
MIKIRGELIDGTGEYLTHHLSNPLLFPIPQDNMSAAGDLISARAGHLGFRQRYSGARRGVFAGRLSRKQKKIRERKRRTDGQIEQDTAIVCPRLASSCLALLHQHLSTPPHPLLPVLLGIVSSSNGLVPVSTVEATDRLGLPTHVIKEAQKAVLLNTARIARGSISGFRKEVYFGKAKWRNVFNAADRVPTNRPRLPQKPPTLNRTGRHCTLQPM